MTERLQGSAASYCRLRLAPLGDAVGVGASGRHVTYEDYGQLYLQADHMRWRRDYFRHRAGAYERGPYG